MMPLWMKSTALGEVLDATGRGLLAAARDISPNTKMTESHIRTTTLLMPRVLTATRSGD
jgi:hypothetical protein